MKEIGKDISVQQMKDRQIGFFYLASPYTHPSPTVVDLRVKQTRRVLGWLLSKGLFVISPIVHCHDTARECALRTDWKWWWEYNLSIMMKSEGIILVKLKGWEESKGVAEELKWAYEADVPIYSIDADVPPLS
jgi:hypothetical protein